MFVSGVTDMDKLDALTLCDARALYKIGMNVFPVPRVDASFGGNKPPFGSTTLLQTSRVDSESLPLLLRGANLAVMTGHSSLNLLVVDCDSVEAFALVGAELEQRGMTTWVRNSARGGQFWFLCADGEAASAKRGAIEIISAARYVVAPPSMHPTGLLLEWIEQPCLLPLRVTLATLRTFESLAGLRLELTTRQVQGGRITVLPLKAHEILVSQDTSAYESNSLAELVACESLVAAGYDDEAIFALFLEYEPPHFLKRRCRRDWFQRHVLDKARAFVKTAPRQGIASVNHDLQTVRAWIQLRAWPGRTGVTDRQVLLALWQRASLDKSHVFRASLREIVELAGVGKQAVIASLARLQTAIDSLPLIQRMEANTLSGAACYRFLLANMESAVCHTINEVIPVDSDGVISDNITAHDAFHLKALGKSALVIWLALLARQDMTQEEIVAATGKARSTVLSALHRLAGAGLTKGLVGRWEGIPASDPILNAIAETYGTYGCAAARAAHHRKERERRVTDVLLKQRQQWEAHNAKRLLCGAGDACRNGVPMLALE